MSKVSYQSIMANEDEKAIFGEIISILKANIKEHNEYYLITI